MEPSRNKLLDHDDRSLLAECDVDTYRASGPGGQKRNKTDSAVRLRHRPTGLVALAGESRSQHDNRRRALKRLRLKIALELRETVNPDNHEPGLLLQAAVGRDGRFTFGQKDARYPRLVAELLDWLAAADGQVGDVARRLGATPTSLTRFLRKDVHLWQQIQAIRRNAGVKPLRCPG